MINWQWKNSTDVTRKGLAAWYQYEAGAVSDGFIPDYSGNARDLTAEIDAPVLTPDVWRGNPAWHFNGSATQPLVWSGTVLAQHIFIVMAFTKTVLSGSFQGVLSGLTTRDVLVGVGGTDKFFDLSATLPDMQYRRGGRYYPASDQKAPVGGAVALVELVSPVPIILDGIQFGQQRSFTDRRGKFYFFEALFYQNIKNTCERRNLFEYFAERYHIWRHRSDDLPLFPFVFDRTTQHEEEEIAEISEAEGGRGRDRVVRYLNDVDEPLQTYDFEFDDRIQREYEAARVFLRQQRLHLPFWIGDTERDQYAKITREPTGFASAGAGGAYRFDYRFQGKIFDYEVITDEPLPAPDEDAPSVSITGVSLVGDDVEVAGIAIDDSEYASLQLFVNGEAYGAPIDGGGGVFAFPVVPEDLIDAENTFYVIATDASGNEAVSETFSATPDPYPPAIPEGLRLSGDSPTDMLVEFLLPSDEEASGAESEDEYLLVV